MNEESLFAAASALPPGSDRNALLDRECCGDDALRRRLEQLLAAHDAGTGILDRDGAAERTVIRPPEPEADSAGPRVGTIVAGRYKLLEQIGEGGMGTVWVAEQTEPVRRKVALKLIKAGMDSRSVIARFEAERQALALMDHPNIARVLDAGTTGDGHPYFAMELVKGVPITEFCDARKLSPRERLELFIPVCQAIQHAHQKGIIHRDIKPSNVLVALHDERPVPKVIDFGVAKAVGQQLTEKTLYTGFGALVGTPAYMAPEQATFNQLDVDTRADVYALGVLLYELLVGSPPFEPERLKRAALDEVLRLVREEEPPRPSARLSTSQARASIAAVRQSDPDRLTRLVRGELDWIVMKALEKDRNRRYETANGFATDVQRYLAGEPVAAVPPSAGYRLRKFAKKNRAVLATTSAFFGLLIVASAISGLLALRARTAEKFADEKRSEAESNEKQAKAHAEDAGYFAKLFHDTAQDEMNAKFDAGLSAASLQIDLDLIDWQSDRQAGLLQLLQRFKTTEMSIPSTVEWTMSRGQILKFQMSDKLFDRQRRLQEFVTVVVLTLGQEVASLLPPITHDGVRVTNYNFKVSPDQRTLLTGGDDGTVRLWDLWTARQIAILQRDNEKVAGRWDYTTDGKTIVTEDGAGSVSLWDATDGSFRAQTERRPNLYAEADNADANKSLSETQLDFWQVKTISRGDCVVIGKDRLLTRHVVVKQRPDTGEQKVFDQFFSGPVELWDTTTGQLVARLDVPDAAIGHLQFLGDGRWISTLENPSTVVVFSSADGRLVSRMAHPEGRIVTGVYASPSNQQVVTDSDDSERANRELAFWETDSWKRMTTVSLASHRRSGVEIVKFDLVSPPELRTGSTFKFLNDELFTLFASNGWDLYYWSLYRVNAPTTPVTTFGAYRLLAPVNQLIVQDNGRIVDAQTGQRLVPPQGSRVHPSLANFAADGRFVVGLKGGGGIIDTLTEKDFNAFADISLIRVPDHGLVWIDHSSRSNDLFIRRFPKLDELNIPLRDLELWVQVGVRGALGPDGDFLPWDKSTWEEKRQELASIKAPYPDFPFPGYVAHDKLHWLRREYEEAAADDKPRLAQELLRRAEMSGDHAEAARWKRVVATLSRPADANP